MRPQCRQRQCRIASGGERELASHRQSLAEVVDDLVTTRLGHEINVVEYQDEGLPALSARIDERR
jgi:hypothetical protein